MAVKSSNNLKRYNNLIGEIEAVYHEASLKFGISDSVSKILYTLSDNGGRCLLNRIKRLTGLSKQTVNSALRSMEDNNLVYLKPVDGKNKEAVFTEKGFDFAEKTAYRLIEIENAVFDSWADEDVELYLTLTDRFLCSLREKVKRI